MMNPHDELEALMRAMPLDWHCTAPGLRLAVDNEIDAVITVHASQVLQSPAPPADATAERRGGLRQLRLAIAARPGVTVVPLSMVDGSPLVWTLPDLRWDETVSVALRLRVPVTRARPLHRLVPLALATLSAVAMQGEASPAVPVELQLQMGCPVLSDEEIADFPRDPGEERALSALVGRPVVPQAAAVPASGDQPLH